MISAPPPARLPCPSLPSSSGTSHSFCIFFPLRGGFIFRKSPSPCGSRSSHVEAFPTDRLLQILIALGQAPEALSAKELSLTLEQPLSSTYRHLKTLLRWGLAEEQAGQGRYLPGPACLQLAKKFDREASLIGLAKPELRAWPT